MTAVVLVVRLDIVFATIWRIELRLQHKVRALRIAGILLGREHDLAVVASDRCGNVVGMKPHGSRFLRQCPGSKLQIACAGVIQVNRPGHPKTISALATNVCSRLWRTAGFPVLQPTVARIAEDCGRANRRISMATSEDFRSLE
jgi:hypothetical protein